MSRRHDQSYKLLFSIPMVVEQMVRHFLNGDLADELDFERVEQLATERAGPDLVRSHADGRKRWTAPDDVFDLIEPVQGWLADYQPRLRHKLLDLRALARQPLPGSNVVSWIASMELDSSAENISRVVRRVFELYSGPEHVRLREAFREWVLGAAESWGIGEETLKQVKSLKEADMRYAGVEELKERAHLEGFGQGQAEGFGQGQAALVCRLAGMKFGARTAAELARLLEGTTDRERVARVGDGILECETGAELLERTRRA